MPQDIRIYSSTIVFVSSTLQGLTLCSLDGHTVADSSKALCAVECNGLLRKPIKFCNPFQIDFSPTVTFDQLPCSQPPI